MYYMWLRINWDRRSMSSRLSEHMWEANRVEWPNRLGYLKSEG